ncbi:MAG TPA: diguanylate cyclase [Gaiellaceae bacterium]|nr:diguanylate cyclase [Gaiellaceae bacterium]
MTPTFKQRLGLAPVNLAPAEYERLVAARAATAGSIGGAMIALLAIVAGQHVSDALSIVVPAAFGACLLGVTPLLRFERPSMAVRQGFAAVSTLLLGVVIVALPMGASYGAIYIVLALYTGFFYSHRQAIWQTAFALVTLVSALFLSYAPAAALERSILFGGVLVGCGAAVVILRGRLDRLVAAARADRAELDAFFQHAPAGFGMLDGELRHERVNQALAEIMGHERHEIEGRTLRELATINADVLEPLARSVIESGIPVMGIEIENSNGDCHLVSYYPVPAGHGVVRVGTAVMDITRLKTVERTLEETNRKLTVLATTDELTQLPNRRMFADQLELALARARRGGLAVAVLCFDLDRFKEVNDTLGHAYGDRMLVEVASLLRTGARDTDVVARVGGDEFLIMLADLDVQEAPELAATVIDRIRGLLVDPLPVDAVEIRVEASIGLAIYPTDSRDAAGLLAVADAAMYVGKNTLTRVA